MRTEVVRCKVLPNNGMQDRAGLVEMIDVAAWQLEHDGVGMENDVLSIGCL